MPKMFSDNIIFMDSEFSSLDPYKGEILSIGLIKPDGKELYLELEYTGEVDEWVKENIIPTLKGPKVSRQKAIEKIKEFVGKRKPYMICYVNQYDSIYWYKLFGVNNNPCCWIPIDFASILWGLGINPEKYYEDKKEFAKKLGIDASRYTLHNALDDARLLRDVYLKFLELSQSDLEQFRKQRSDKK